MIPLAMLLVLAAVQQGAAPPPPIAAPQADPAPTASEDIVVTGLKDIDSFGSLVTRATLGSGRVGTGNAASRTIFAQALRFAGYAIDATGDTVLLRQALDGRINSARQSFAQAQLVRRHATCTQNPGVVLATNDSSKISAGYGPYDGTYYDRGALFIKALQHYAPDLKLTKTQTSDRAVQDRFNVRETPLASFRLPVDRRYFETAVCFVRVQPELSVRLVHTDNAADVGRVEAAIVNRARECVGGARKVYFDPTQFRFYIADAVYRWAVAAKEVDSLIPTG